MVARSTYSGRQAGDGGRARAAAKAQGAGATGSLEVAIGPVLGLVSTVRL